MCPTGQQFSIFSFIDLWESDEIGGEKAKEVFETCGKTSSELGPGLWPQNWSDLNKSFFKMCLDYCIYKMASNGIWLDDNSGLHLL